MRLIVLLVAASIFTAASVDSVKCVKFTNPYRDAECDANEKCFSYTTLQRAYHGCIEGMETCGNFAKIKDNFICFICDVDLCNTDGRPAPVGTLVHEKWNGTYKKYIMGGRTSTKSETMLLTLSILINYLS